MSILTYGGDSSGGGITLPYPFSTNFEQTAVYETEGNTDYIVTKFNINVQAILNANYVDYVGGGMTEFNTENPADMMVEIRRKLLAPRKRLSFKVSGTELIPFIPNQNGTVDCINGPQPQYCNIQQLTNESFMISFGIIANYWENQTANGLTNRNIGSPVLWNRWSEQVTYDETMHATKNRSGKYFIRADNNAGQQADQLRVSMAVVAIPAGFLRQRARYKIDPNGLAMEYELEDKEVDKMPPSPAFKADGHYAETTTAGGATRMAQCWVRLQGAKNTDRSALIQAAVAVCSAKMNLGGVLTLKSNNQFRAMLSNAAIRVGLYDNWVECTMQCAMQPRTTANGQGRVQGVAGPNFANFAITPGSDGVNFQPPYQYRGTAPGATLLQAAAYYDPSLKATLDKQTGQMTQGKVPGTAGLGN